MGFKRDISDLIDETRSISDMQNTQFVTDTEIVAWLNKGYRRLYNHLLNAYDMYKISSDDLTMIANQKDYTLPADFLKLVKVFWVSGGKEYPLTRKTLHNVDADFYSGGNPKGYSLLGDEIRFWPTPQAAGTIRLYYNPAATVFTSASTDIDFEQHQDEYCIYYAAREAKIKEETPFVEIERKMLELEAACRQIIQPRDTSDSAQITDVYSGHLRDSYSWGF